MTAVRLGWSVAEIRGRYRIGDNPERLGLAMTEPMKRFENALPLMSERSRAEQRIEAEGVLRSLAKALKVDVRCSELTGQPDAAKQVLASDRLTVLCKAMSKSIPEMKHRNWLDFTDFLYAWDAVIQDELACQAFGMSSAYQLGRGLAEVFWAIDPSAPTNDARSPAVLLGPNRVEQLDDLLSRLSHHFPDLAADAVTYSLDQWAGAAKGGQITDTPGTYKLLAVQCGIWRDMLIAGKDPKLYLEPKTFLARAGQLRAVARRFLPEVGILGIGVAVLAVGAGLLSSKGASQALGGALAVVGAAGVSLSGVTAKLRNATSNLVAHLRNELYEGAIAEVTCYAPAPPSQTRQPTPLALPTKPPTPGRPAGEMAPSHEASRER